MMGSLSAHGAHATHSRRPTISCDFGKQIAAGHRGSERKEREIKKKKNILQTNVILGYDHILKQDRIKKKYHINKHIIII